MYLRDPSTRSLYFSTSKPHIILSTLQILTKDSVTVFVNAIMYYKVRDATLAVANVDDYSGSARLLAATTLRNVLGTRNLGDILSDRESIAHEMQVLFNDDVIVFIHVLCLLRKQSVHFLTALIVYFYCD